MEYDFDGCEVENVLDNIPNKKRKNSKAKGNRVELELTKILSKHFDKSFSRAVGSGNRWGQVAHMPSHAKATLVGDICAPEGFKWVIECKGGYEDKIDLPSKGRIKQLDAFIDQSLDDAKRSNRLPIIMWKRARRCWLAMVQMEHIDISDNEYYTRYRNWIILSLEDLLEQTPENYWFNQESEKSS